MNTKPGYCEKSLGDTKLINNHALFKLPLLASVFSNRGERSTPLKLYVGKIDKGLADDSPSKHMGCVWFSHRFSVFFIP